MLLTTPRKQLSIEVIVPDEIKLDYFDSMHSKKNLYICVTVENSATPKVFLENEAPDEVDGIVKVFFRKSDIMHYMNVLIDQKKTEGDFIKYWEANYEELVKLLIKIDTNNKAKTRKGVRGITCIVMNGAVVNIDVFWTNEKKLML